MSERAPRAPRAPLLRLDRVHARDAAGPGGRARGAISAMSATLGQGAHAFLGTPEDGLLALAEVLTGARPPLRGEVRVVGEGPATTPSIRARIGVLAPEPRLPPAPTVGDAVRIALRARGEQGHRIDAVLDPFGLGALHARRPRTLSVAEARAVELSLALTTPAPLLLVLHEPLADIALPEPERVRAHLGDLARAGACIVITTASPADAHALANRVFVLHRGLVVRETTGEGNRLALGEARLRAFIAPPSSAEQGDVRALAAALSAHPELCALSWEDAPAHAPAFASIELAADTLEACANALVSAAIVANATIEAYAPVTPDLAEVRATTDTLLRLRWTALRAAAPRALPAPDPGPAPAPAPDPAPALAAPAPAPASPEGDPVA